MFVPIERNWGLHTAPAPSTSLSFVSSIAFVFEAYS